MPDPTDAPLAHELLQAFLKPDPVEPTPLERWLPSSGTLPGITRLGGHHPLAHALVSGLRSCGQVIFINNPLTGLLLLLAMQLQSAEAALLTLVGIAAAQGMARAVGADRQTRRQGIFGFNGALVGGAVACFADLGPDAGHFGPGLWWLLALVGAALTTLLMQGPGRWMVRRLALPPLTLPFCLISWALLLAAGLAHPALLLNTAAAPPPAMDGSLQAVLLGVPRGFGQVFFLPGLLSGALILLAVAIASPLAALLGMAGAVASGLTALLSGTPPAVVAQGLSSYDGVLTALAVGGIFYPLSRLSLIAALLAAAASTLLMPPLQLLLQTLSGTALPLLTLPFIVATWGALLLLPRLIPTLIPVGLHGLHTPEEHRQRLVVSRTLLGDLRRQLRDTVAGDRYPQLLARCEPALVSELETLFASLDRDGDGWLNLSELQAGLGNQAEGIAPRTLADLLQAMDLDGNGRVDAVEFSELVLRLRRLRAGQERLLQYLMPIDADGDDRLDAAEIDRLLRSVGQDPLPTEERQALLGTSTSTSLSWRQFLDRLLLS
jgi:urea transporter/Ca2+-binding EF-hand superfamily protein